MNTKVSLDVLSSWAKRRGFVFPSSEIYGGFSSSYDYGPLGVILKNNIANLWWKNMVQERKEVEGLDGAIFTHPKVWEVSGHVAGFNDVLVDCVKCKKRFRLDHLIEKALGESMAGKNMEEMNEIVRTNNLKCLECQGEITLGKKFNLLVETFLGPVQGAGSKVYLRGETCQTIFLNYKNILETMRQRVPFGIAQMGKAFRNEITLGPYLFRTREFEQLEMEYFVKPESADEWFQYWKKERLEWYRDKLGFKNVRERQQEEKERAHYARDAYDLEYEFPMGWKEIEGIHDRGEHDLGGHGKGSGAKLDYFNQETGERFVPWVVETSAGLGRLFLATLFENYHEEEVKGEKRVVVSFPKEIAPVKVAILPLSKKESLSKMAIDIFDKLKSNWECQFDETQSIGKRYRRQDEIGTLYCVTVDFESLNDQAVTVRDRDTMKQERVRVEKLKEYLEDKIGKCK
jgi:glycyl-tRNA synthetase